MTITSPNRFLVDCDTGRDDALCFWMAATLNLPLLGAVASYGNTTIDNVIDNTARVLSHGGHKSVLLFKGPDRPGTPHAAYRNTVLARHEINGNGLCNLLLPESPLVAQPHEALADQVRAWAADGPIDYLIIGPATNFAQLCRTLGDDAPRIFNRITMMGGKFAPLWAQMPGADFNLLCDPAAVEEVMAQGLTINFVPMDETWPVFLPLAEVEALVPQNPRGQTAKDLMLAHLRHFAPEPFFRFHDPVALLAMGMPEAFRDTRLVIVHDETQDDFGRLRETDDGHAARIFAPSASQRPAILAAILENLGLQRA